MKQPALARAHPPSRKRAQPLSGGRAEAERSFSPARRHGAGPAPRRSRRAPGAGWERRGVDAYPGYQFQASLS